MLYMSTFSSSLTSILLSFLLSNLSNAFKSDDDYNRTCPPLHCGDIKEITYPFSTITNDPPCGFYTIKCNQSTPTIQINETGRSYTVKNISYAEDQITIQDHQLYEQLKAKECNFLYKFETPKLPFISIEIITPEITFLNCKTNHDRSQSGLKIFRYTGCRDSYLYYIPQPNSLPTQSFLPECSVFNFPVSKLPAPSDQNWTDDTLLSLLNEGFTLRWDVSAECARCHFERGHCRTENSTGKFWCCFEDCMVANSSGGWDKKKKIAVGVGTGGGSLLLAALLSIVYYHCRKCSSSSSSTLLSRTIAFDQSSSLDLEDSGTIFPTHIFTYKELQEATNNFDPSKILGDGGFGTVYHGKLRDGRFVAVKRLYENNCKRAEQFINEVKILSRLRHQHLISLYGCTSRYRHELLLVYEFIPNGTVADHIHGHRANTLPWPIRLNIAIETADAIAYLHAIEPQIIHRDVKTNNILLDNNFHVKVADFGLSRLFPTDVTHVSTTPQGTPGYVDPEYHQCYQLTEKSDVYSFGVVLIELISSKPAVDVKRHQHEINLSSLAIRKIHNHALHELVDPCLGFESNGGVRKMITLVAELAFMCLQMEKDMRPSMEEVLEVLRGIEKEGYVEEKTNGVDSDDIGLLNISSSPVSVANKWVSRSTTPSNSA